MNKSTRENLVEGSIWLRGLHMLIFVIAYNLAEAALALTVIFQFFCALITGRVNEPLLTFSKNATLYIKEVFEFLTFNSEVKPFPFSPWPDELHTGDEWLDEAYDGYEDEEIADDVMSTDADFSQVSSQEEVDSKPDASDPDSKAKKDPDPV